MSGFFHALTYKKARGRSLGEWIAGLGGTIACREIFPAREARYGSFTKISGELALALKERGIERLYSHQSLAAESAAEGRDVIVATPTASGKTLCYNIPVIDSVLAGGRARSLYLFPPRPWRRTSSRS